MPSSELYAPTAEGEGRLLLLIDAFSLNGGAVQGRTKLAKLDFLLRYPAFHERAMQLRKLPSATPSAEPEPDLETRMVRYRYGPWDPAHYGILGSLIGRGLVEVVREPRVFAFRTTARGSKIAKELAESEPWIGVSRRATLLRRAFRTQTGTFLKDWIYENFPEVTQASWGDSL
jgi:hypothetical protein